MTYARLISLLVATLLFGCASTADIDVSKVDSTCGQTCSANYSSCGQQFTIVPIMQQNQCVDALRMCVRSCPAR